MKDVFGTIRAGCKEAPTGCGCTDFCSLRDAMTEDERQAEGAFVSCQRKSELFLTCACGHPAWHHTARPEGGEDAPQKLAGLSS